MKRKIPSLLIFFLLILIGTWGFKMAYKNSINDHSTTQILSLEEKENLVKDVSEENGKTVPQVTSLKKIPAIDPKKTSYKNILDDPKSLEAKEKEETWASNRLEYFENELLLNQEQIIELKNLWEEVQKTEKNLFAEELLSNEPAALKENIEKIKSNRLEYQKQIKKVIGEESFAQYLVYYQSHWNIKGGSSLNKIHLPLQ